jgi:ABC-type branched-subunit amino acid transport system substrate-binding protein
MRRLSSTCLGIAAALLMCSAGDSSAPAYAARLSNNIVRVGILTDSSGSYSDISGPGAVEAAKMAVKDFGGTMFGVPIEVVVADHQNKPDVGLAKAREWYEVGGVDAIFEMIASSVAIPIFVMTKEKKKIAIASRPASSALTGKNCSPYGVHWTYDTYALFARRKSMPTMVQAGVYSSVLHYLKAVEAAGTDDPTAVMVKMREAPVRNMFAENGKIRDDGRMVHDMYVLQVKSPQDSRYPWDYYKIIKTNPGEEAFRPLAGSECPFVK